MQYRYLHSGQLAAMFLTSLLGIIGFSPLGKTWSLDSGIFQPRAGVKHIARRSKHMWRENLGKEEIITTD